MSPILLADSALLTETLRAATVERRSTAHLLALLAELDRRQLYLGEGYPSLFSYCTRGLRLSEPAAYVRITAARAARDFPVILTLLAEGEMTLTTVTLLAAHLTPENYDALLSAARFKTKREVEHLIATLYPQPDIESRLRRLPLPTRVINTEAASDGVEIVRSPADEIAQAADETAAVALGALTSPRGSPQGSLQASPAPAPSPSPAPSPTTDAPQMSLPEICARSGLQRTTSSHAIVSPIAADRYLLKVTLSGESHEKLERIRDLLRHSIPNGDPAAIVERALAVLLEKLEKSKCAATAQPVVRPHRTRRPRHMPASVKRAVWARDQGRCAFVGSAGRCPEKGFLEFHHLVPFAAGGPATVENVELRCRAHNAYESEKFFGAGKRPRGGRPIPIRLGPLPDTTLSG